MVRSRFTTLVTALLLIALGTRLSARHTAKPGDFDFYLFTLS
jgi:hypothetical protein